MGRMAVVVMVEKWDLITVYQDAGNRSANIHLSLIGRLAGKSRGTGCAGRESGRGIRFHLTMPPLSFPNHTTLSHGVLALPAASLIAGKNSGRPSGLRRV